MKLARDIFVSTACLVLWAAAPVSAQQTDQQGAPIPAYRSPLPGVVDTGTDGNADGQKTQEPPLSSVQGLTLGLEARRTYWQPHADVSSSGDSNALETPHGTDWRIWSSVAGGVDVHRVSGKSDLTLSSIAGGTFTNDSTVGNGAVLGLNFSDKFSFRRSVLAFYDQSNYLPESALGFGGLGAAGGASGGSGAPGLAFNPGQSVLTGRGQLLNNSDAVELDQYFSARTSLTFSGGYSLLHYFDSNSLFNYGVLNARGGYNYQATAKDTAGLIYTFSDFRYSASGRSLMDHTIEASYGRVITGRLAFQIAAGPEFVVPSATGTGAGPVSLLPTQTQYLWALNTSLKYQKQRYGLDLTYNHGVSGGSGVLIGSKTDVVTGSATRQMSRTFSSSLTGGYSRSQGLSGTASANQLYDYWFGGVSLSEPVGETLGITLSYQVQYQTSNSAACVGPTCGGSVLRQMISVGVGWHERPLLF
jgi:hypothetical protein